MMTLVFKRSNWNILWLCKSTCRHGLGHCDTHQCHKKYLCWLVIGDCFLLEEFKAWGNNADTAAISVLVLNISQNVIGRFVVDAVTSNHCLRFWLGTPGPGVLIWFKVCLSFPLLAKAMIYESRQACVCVCASVRVKCLMCFALDESGYSGWGSKLAQFEC